jgi:hypothetical protein
MRVAICMSGGLRTFETAAPLMMEKFIKPLKGRGCEIDFFFYGLSNKKGLCNNTKDVNIIYKPKKYVVKDWDQQSEQKVYSGFSKEEIQFMHSQKRPESNLIANLSQMYNIKKVFELMEQYEKENNFVYDLTIRSRVDCYYFTSLTDEQIAQALISNNVLIPNAWDFKEVAGCGISDAFALGTSEALKRYSKIYDYVYQCAKDLNLFHVESLTGHYITNVAKLNRISVSPKDHWFWFEYPPGASQTTINRKEYGI